MLELLMSVVQSSFTRLLLLNCNSTAIDIHVAFSPLPPSERCVDCGDGAVAQDLFYCNPVDVQLVNTPVNCLTKSVPQGFSQVHGAFEPKWQLSVV